MTLPRPRQIALALATALPLIAWAHDTGCCPRPPW
jgi:hypothetical protein